MKSMAIAKLKRVRALELVAEGLSYTEVAKQAGYRHRASAFRAVSRALAEREVAGVDGYRGLELARLDQLQAALCASWASERGSWVSTASGPATVSSAGPLSSSSDRRKATQGRQPPVSESLVGH